MATSGSYDFNLNRNQIVKKAFELLNLYGASATISNVDMKDASEWLNMIVQFWSATGIKLWKRKTGTLFLAKNTKQYSLGPSGSHATLDEIANTTLSGDEASGQTVLSITSTTGMSANDNVGIKLDDGTRQWTTISSVDSAVQITVVDPLTGDASSGNTVVSYTSKMPRPHELIVATRFNLVQDEEIPITAYSHDEYFEQPGKSQSSDPVAYYYDRQTVLGKLNIYPQPDNVDIVIKFSCHIPIEDFDSATDDADFPKGWILPLAYQLAVHLATPNEKQVVLEPIKAMADQLLALISSTDTDVEPVQIEVGYNANRYR